MKTCFTFRFIVTMMGLVLTYNNASAQDTTIISDSIVSKILKEQRKIKICLPDEYVKESDVKYDVVYILDGETNFDDFLYIYKFARHQSFIPPLILVAITNVYTMEGNMRDRDFSPEKTFGNEKAGGADNFIDFLKRELIPYVNKKLPASGENSLFGHSLGGLFTMYVLLKEPGLFNNYYCSDPAFPWNNRYIIALAQETFRDTPELKKTLWINGVETTYRNVGIGKMDSVLGSFAPGGLRWKVSIYKNETHMSVIFKGIYDALKYSYYGYNSKKLVEFHPNNGSVLEGKPVPVFLNGSFPDVHYTADGSDPDTASELAPQMIEITGPATLTVKWLGDNKKYVTASTGNFVLSKVWPAFQNVKNIKHGGLQYRYYEGKWEKLPDFDKLEPINTGIADSSFSFEKLPAGTNFGCVFEGYIKIEEEGYYLFALCSNDGSKFFIDGREIINNDGVHGDEWYKSYAAPLQKGYYPVRLEYFNSIGSPHLDIIYLSPNTHETLNLSFKMMYYK